MSGRPLRVALVAGEDPGWGGIGTYTGIVGRALGDAGHDVRLVLRGWEHDAVEDWNGLRVERVTVPEPSWRRGTVAATSRLWAARESVAFAARVERRLASLRSPVDVVEAPDFHAPGLGIALRRRARRRAPALVVRLHTPSFITTALASEPRTLDVRATEALERCAATLADRVTCPSEALARRVGPRWRLSSRRVRVAPNPVDSERFTPLEDGAGGDDEPNAGAPLITVVGRVERLKGPDVALAAMPAIRAVVPGARLRLTGDDSTAASGGPMVDALRRRAADLGLSHDALVHDGVVAPSALPDVYRAAAVCVVPSRFDNFPYTCLEAMACARPVVASAAGGAAEIISDGHDGVLVPPEDPGALAAAIVRLLRDPELRTRLGRAARETVVRAYSPSAIAAESAALYASLAGTAA
jgi:glycosyltransferase involved in cell wall biosynthesis